METLECIQKQSFPYFECILVDDGTITGDLKPVNSFCEKDKRFLYYKRPPSYLEGGNGARNFGASLANFKYLIFIDSDDILIESALYFRKQEIENNPDFFYWIFPTGLIRSGEKFQNFSSKSPTDIFEGVIQYLAFKMPWQIGSTVWLKDFFLNDLKGWNSSLKCYQDFELYIRAILNFPNAKVFINKDPDFFYRRDVNQSITGQYKTSAYFFEARKAVLLVEKCLMTNYSIAFTSFVKRLFIYEAYFQVGFFFPLKMIFAEPLFKVVSQRIMLIWIVQLWWQRLKINIIKRLKVRPNCW